MSRKKIITNALFIVSAIITTTGCLFVLYFGLRIFVFDTYPVNTGSMFPTIAPGDRIVVNKLIFGARLYKNLDFLQGGKLKTLRMKGHRGINYNDIVVLNYAHPMEFDIHRFQKPQNSERKCSVFGRFPSTSIRAGWVCSVFLPFLTFLRPFERQCSVFFRLPTAFWILFPNLPYPVFWVDMLRFIHKMTIWV